MSATDVPVFEKTLRKTEEWLREIMREIGSEDHHLAYLVLRGTLQVLRDRLPLEETAHLGAQLPMLVRGFYYEGWHPARDVSRMHRDEFLERVQQQLAGAAPTVNMEAAVRAVFHVLSQKIAKGEIEQIEQALPPDLRELWPARSSS